MDSLELRLETRDTIIHVEVKGQSHQSIYLASSSLAIYIPAQID